MKSFRDFNIDISYKNIGENTFSEIINPLLSCSREYRRSVGFFSSSSINFIKDGVMKLAKNGGKILLATSPKLSDEDIEAINCGYKDRNEIIIKSAFNELINAIDNANAECLENLYLLIRENIMDIKIVYKKTGMYHDKLAVLYDNYGNSVVFVGSPNESASGYNVNYEKVRVYRSWKENDRVEDEIEEFNSIWNNSNEFLDVLEFDDAYKKKILEKVETKIQKKMVKKEKIELRKYQEDAVKAWVDKGYRGFFVMATGTGKTITSLFAIKQLLEKQDVISVIAVPYKHLVSQWQEDVKKIFDDNYVTYLVSSEVPNWDKTIKNAIFNNFFKKDKKIIIITTIKSFYSERFSSMMNTYKGKRLLVVDEAHNFISKIDEKKYDIEYEYRLGLSATPVFGDDYEKTNRLCDFFGGIAYSLPIEKALGKFLVNYHYIPIFVDATDEDEKKFKHYSKVMMGLRDAKTGRIRNVEEYMKAHRGRLRAIAMAENKLENISYFIDGIDTNDHFIIYCSDGKIGDETQLIEVVKLLNEKGYHPSQFTCTESMEERVKLIDNFNSGDISTLVAIKCLDEGINIPSIKTALLLSSNDNYREFVQRRGRILRKYDGKEEATIIDILVKPSQENQGMAKIELKRFYEYAHLSLDKDTLLPKLNEYLKEYSLSIDDVKMNNSDLEGETDYE